MSRWQLRSAVCFAECEPAAMMFASSFSLPSLPAAPRGSIGAVPPAAGAQLPSAPGSAPPDRVTGSCPWTRAGPCWEGKSLLLCNCYFGAQTSAGKGNISVVITGTSFSEFLGAQILLLTAWGGDGGFPVRLPYRCRAASSGAPLQRWLWLNIHSGCPLHAAAGWRPQNWARAGQPWAEPGFPLPVGPAPLAALRLPRRAVQ